MPWLITNIFRRPGVSFLLGTFGSKKTWLALDLAISVALGRAWLGYQGPAAPVLFLDYDHGLSELRRRLRSVLLAHAAPPTTPLHFFSARPPDFNNNEVGNLIAASQPIKPGLIVLDNPFTPASFQAGAGHTLSPILSSLRTLASSTNACVLVLLHTRKRRTGLGAALCSFGVDQVLALDSPLGKSWVHLRTIACTNQPPLSITASLRLAQARFGKIIHDAQFRDLSPAPIQPSPLLGRAGFAVLGHLANKGKSTSSQILSNVTGAVPGRLIHVINELLHDGYIYRTNPGSKGVIGQYDLTPAGMALAPESWGLVK